MTEPFPPHTLADHYRDRSVLITGGLGFLGSNLALSLARLGARIAIIDSLIPEGGGNQFHQRVLQKCASIEVGDVRESVRLERLLAGCDVIFHLAARTGHLDSMRSPLEDLDSNVAGTLALLESCRRQASPARIVFTSTRQLYGRPRHIPVDETHPINPVDVNAIHKLAAEQHTQLYNRLYGLPTTILRLTNVIGPGMRIRDARQSFMGEWLRRLLQQQPLEVWGGSQQRDLLDVEDCVAALLLAGSHPVAVGQIYNVGHARSVRLDELADRLIQLNGAGQRIVRDFSAERVPIDIGSFATNSNRIRDQLGWMPHTDLDTTLHRTLTYYRQHGEHYA